MKLQNKKPYLLYVGNAFPHKNLKRLILAFRLIQDNITNINLVFVGNLDNFYKKLQTFVKNENINNIYFLGRVSDKDLDYLYKNACIYVFPSLAEGFGLPGLEAMKNGLPVASSNSASLPEIYGKAAVYFNPKDINDMVKKILILIKDKEKREFLRNKGKNQVNKYSWEKCAKKTLNVYNSLK
ncbi:MAG TPA: glycosyltransferase family 1 protein [Patescibacteria group bacterium]|nr:glycosyltransferase family 1 protein [Patescibacteria group bacterium]